MWTGLVSVLEPPSPKSHAWVMVPSESVDVDVNVHCRKLQATVNPAMGSTFGMITTGLAAASSSDSDAKSVTASVTSNVSAPA